MQYVIGIILVIVIVILLLGLIFSLLQLFVITLPIWGGALALIILILFLFRLQRMHCLNSPRILSKVITVSFDGQKLNWSLNESQIERHANAGLAVFFCTLIGIISIWLIQNIFYNNEAFQGITFFEKKIPAKVSFIVSYILSGIVVIITIIMSKPREILLNSIRKRINHLMSKINLQVERIKELRTLENSIKSITSELNVHFPIDFQTEIQEFISVHKDELLSDTTEMNKLIEKNIEQAQEDNQQLEKANDLYKAAMELYTQTAHEVNKTGSISLIKDLEHDYEGLISENLKSMLLYRKWENFNYGLNSIITHLYRLNELAIKYQKEGYEKKAESFKEETDEEKAYRILNIHHDVTNEQIKRVYKALAGIWHSDRKTIKSETRIKDIIWAYHFLRNKREF